MAEYITNVKSGSTSNVTYVGSALPGAATSAAVWRIQQIEVVSGADDTVVLYAGGDTAFDNIFDDRESLSYS